MATRRTRTAATRILPVLAAVLVAWTANLRCEERMPDAGPTSADRLRDHASFWDRGYRAVMVTDSAFFRNPHYHRASDTMETLDFVFMAELVRSLKAFLERPHR